LRDLRREWFNLAQGRTAFEVSDPQHVPNFLKLAVEQSGCRYEDGLRMAPIHFIRVAHGRLALVPCGGPLKTTQRAFDLSDLQKPLAIKFPFLAYPDGIGASGDAPGFLTWDKDAGFFRAETTLDISNTPARYTYRFDGPPSNFVLLRVEVRRNGIGDWTTIWDAPRLSDLAKPNQ
jgi:hypothetical protein